MWPLAVSNSFDAVHIIASRSRRWELEDQQYRVDKEYNDVHIVEQELGGFTENEVELGVEWYENNEKEEPSSTNNEASD